MDYIFENLMIQQDLYTNLINTYMKDTVNYCINNINILYSLWDNPKLKRSLTCYFFLSTKLNWAFIIKLIWKYLSSQFVVNW